MCGAAALLAQAAAAAPLPLGTLPDAANAVAKGAGGLDPVITAPSPGGTLLTVDVKAPRSIIDWKGGGFKVAGDSTVDFKGMAVSDIVVNRSPVQMVIEGTVKGTGSLWFLSGQGVLVNGGTISAAHVLMSNGELNDAAFLASPSLGAALASIEANAGLIRMDGIDAAVHAEVTASGDVVLSSATDLAVTEARGGSVSVSAAGWAEATTLTATAGDVVVQAPSIELYSPGTARVAAQGGVTFDGALKLDAPAKVTASGAVQFKGTVDGPGALTVFTPSQVLMAQDVGATPLSKLALTGDGPLVFQGAAITTTDGMTLPTASLEHSAVALSAGAGAITLRGDVTATGAVTFDSAVDVLTNSVVKGGSAVFAHGVDGGALIVDVTGAAEFQDAVGASDPLSSLGVRADHASFAGTNRVGVLAASVASGGLAFQADGDLSVGAVGGVSGLTAKAGDIDIGASGALRLHADLATAAGATTRLTAASIDQPGGSLRTGKVSATLLSEGRLSLGDSDNAFDSLEVAALAPSGKASDILVRDSRSLTVATPLKASGDVMLRIAAGDLALGAVQAGQEVRLRATQGGLSATSIKAGTDYSARAMTFTDGALAAQVGRDVAIRATGDTDLVVPSITAKRNLTLRTDKAGLVTTGDLIATGGVVTLDSAADLTLGGLVRTGAPGRSVALLAGGSVSQSGGAVQTAALTGAAKGGFALDRPDNAFDTLGALTVGGDLKLVDGRPLDLSSPLGSTSGGVDISAPSLTFGEITAAKGLTLTASSGDIRGVRATAQAGDLRLDAQQDILVSDAVLPAAGPAGLSAKGGDLVLAGRTIEVAGPLTASDGQVQASAGDGALTLGDVTAGKDIDLAAKGLGGPAPGDGGAITAGALSAGEDVALYSADGGVQAASISAGDDVAIRALYGAVTVNGPVMSGRGGPDGPTTGPGMGAADRLSAESNFPDFLTTTVFTLAGHDVDVLGQAITVTGPIVAGTAGASAAAPDLTSSDVRLASVLQPTPTAGLAAGVTVGDVTATRDIQIDSAGGVQTGALLAGQDIALLARGGDVGTGALTAGRHAVAYSMAGRVHIAGAVQAGRRIDGLDPQSAGDTPDGAGERLAQYIGYLDLDEASRPYIAGPGDLMIKTSVGDVQIDGATTAAGSVRIQSADAIHLAGPVQALGGDIRLDAAATSAGATIATGGLDAAGDVAVWGRGGGVFLGGAAAGDDVVVRAAGSVAIDGDVRSGRGGPALADAGSGGDRLVARASPIVLEGHAYDLAGGDIDIKTPGAIHVAGGMTAAGDGSDLRLHSGAGGIQIADADAGGDVLLDAAKDVAAGSLSAGRDVGVRTAGGSIGTGGISAGDDIALRATGTITVAGDLSAGSAPDSTADDQAADLIAGKDPLTLEGASFGLAGGDIDLKAPGDIHVTGRSTALGTGSDLHLQSGAGAIQIADADAGGDVLLDAAKDVAAGSLSAGRDVGLRAAAGSIGTGGISAGDDVALRATGTITVAGDLSAGSAPDSTADDQAADLIAGKDPLTLEGRSFGLAGGDIDLKAPGDIHIAGKSTALGTGSDLRLHSGSSIQIADADAGGDVLLDAAKDVAAGSLSAGRDVGLRAAAGSIGTGGISAGDDVALRATGTITVAGDLSSGSAPDSTADDQAADLIAGKDPLTLEGRSFGLAGGDIDIKAPGDIHVAGKSTALGTGSDLHLQSGAGAIQIADADAGGDVLLDAAKDVAAGSLSAGRDVGLRAAAGSIGTGGISAGDDVALRATGTITVAGDLSAGSAPDSTADDQAADLIAGKDPLTLEGASFGLAGGDIDLKAPGDIHVTGKSTALGTGSDLRLHTGSSIQIADADAGGDVLLDAAKSVTAGDLAAGRDVGARAAAGSVSTGGISAGDDVALRAPGGITVAGNIAAGSGADSADDGQAADLIAGADPIALGGATYALNGGAIDLKTPGELRVTGAATALGALSDVRMQTVGTGGVQLGAATAGRDVLVDSAQGAATGQLAAGRDVAVRAQSGGASLGGAAAGDDVLVRATGTITVAGDLDAGAGGGADAPGVAEDLLALPGMAMTVQGQTFDLGGQDVDVRGAEIAVGGAANAVSDVRLQATLGGLGLGAAAAGGDVLLDAPGAIHAGALHAGGDVGVRGGGVAVGDASAGDDVVLRSSGDLTAGVLTAGGGAETTGAGDLLGAPDPILGLGFGGGNVDVKATGGVTTGGGAATADYRVQGAGVTVGDVLSGLDIRLDGGLDVTGALSAGGLIDIDAHAGRAELISARGGLDVTIRAAGGVRAGALSSGGDLVLQTGAIQLTGDASAGRDLRIETTGAATLAGLLAGQDVQVEAPGSISAGVVTAGRDIAVGSTGGDISLAGLGAKDDAVLRAAGAVSVSGASNVGGGPDAAGAADDMFDTDRTALSGDFALLGANLDVKSGGAITLGGPASAGADVRLQTTGPAASISTDRITAGGEILLDGAGAAAVRAGDLAAAGGDVAVRGRGGGDVALAGVEARDDIVVRTTGAVDASGPLKTDGGEVLGVGDRLLAAEGAIVIGGQSFDLAGSNLDVRAGRIGLAGPVASSGAVQLQSTGQIATADISAPGDVVVDAGGAASLGGVTAGRDVVLRSDSAGVSLREAAAGDDLVIRAPGDIVVAGGLRSGAAPTPGAGAADRLAAFNGEIAWADDLTGGPVSFDLSRGDLDLRSAAGVTVGGAILAQGSQARFEAHSLSLAGVEAGQLLFARAATIAVGGDWKAPRVRIEATAPDGLALGSAAAGSAATGLDQAAFDHIVADQVQLLAGDSSGALRGAGVTVGALSVNVDRIRSSLELYAGPSAAVQIVGRFAPSRTAPLGLQIGLPSAGAGAWTPQTIRVVSDNGGSIGYSVTRDGVTFLDQAAFGAVELNAVDSILAGSQAFIDKLATVSPGGVASVVKTFTAEQAPGGGSRVLMTTGALTLRADRIASQDTSIKDSLVRTGLLVTGELRLGRTVPDASGVALPDVVELYGAIRSGPTLLINENAALSNQIVLIDGVRPRQFYRLNTCVILQPGACTATGGAPQFSAPNQFTRLELLDRQDSGVSDDPTVASATNEEIWRDPE
jgi:hypothetical protein